LPEQTGAEVVLHGVLSKRHISAGDIRVSDVWQMVPYENTIGCAWLTLAEIRAIMEEATEYLGTDRYFGAWGLRYELHPNAPPGKRIRNLRAADGRPVHAKRRIKVALNSYHLAGGGGRFPALVRAVNSPNARLELVGTTTRDMVMAHIRRQRVLSISAGTNAVVVRGEPSRGKRK
jgi:2',3'-cyclic-nucleotide 2'-phosphodiesterase (5'-nucleotidase family)